jgi:hypothetical protein
MLLKAAIDISMAPRGRLSIAKLAAWAGLGATSLGFWIALALVIRHMLL